MWTSASSSAWSNPTPSVANADFVSAPAIQILDAAAGRPVRVARRGVELVSSRGVTDTDGVDQPGIDAPLQYERNNVEPITFLVTPGHKRLFAIEVATESSLFDDEETSRRTPNNFYGSRRELLTGSDEPDGRTTYSLPQAAWSTLRQAGQLYYRVLVPADADSEAAPFASSIANSKDAPSVALIGRLGQRLPTVVCRPEEDLWREET